MKRPIYFDFAATTPVDPSVAHTMLNCLTADGIYANSASSHVLGQLAQSAVDRARQQVADLLNAEPSEIIWTSGATEANNLALKGIAALYQRQGRHIVTLKTEHPSVLDTCQQLEKQGFQVTYLTPLPNGRLDLALFNSVLRSDTILVSIMHVNNETGVVQDLAAIAEITSKKGILLHTDAVQGVGKIAIDVKTLPVDLVSLSAHKFYGPKGIGALYIRRKPRVRVAAMLHGGGQEQGMRSGTLPVHQIVGMGEAAAIALSRIKQDYINLAELKQYLLKQLEQLPYITIHGDLQHHYPGIINICIAGLNAAEFVKTSTEFALSVGSACHSKGIEASYVLRAMGVSEAAARNSVRISLGRGTTRLELDLLIAQIKQYYVSGGK